jgi:predicted permease
MLFVALAVPGYLLVKCKAIKAEHSGVLSKLLMNIGVPFMVLGGTMQIELNATTVKMVLLIVGLTIAFLLGSFFLTVPITRGVETKQRNMMRYCAMFPNNGFLGIPLAQAVFGIGSMAFVTVVVANVITNIALFTLAVYLISGDKSTISFKKALVNPVLIAFLLGIVFNLLDVGALVPEVVTYSTHFSGIVTPISMIILGMKMGEVKILSLFTKGKMYYVALWKLVLFPVLICAILLGAYLLFPNGLLTAGVILGMFIAFATPSSGLASTLADAYDGDAEGAVSYTLGTTILSIATISILYWLLTLCL